MINCNFVSFLQIYNFEGKQIWKRNKNTLPSSIFYNRRNFRQASSRKPFFLRDWKNDQSRGMPFALFNFADINCRRTLAANPRVFPCRMRTMAAGWIVRIVRETETGLIHRSESVARVLRLRPLKHSLSLSATRCTVKSRTDRHVESGRVPDTAATWSIKTMRSPLPHSSSQVDKSRWSFDVSRSGIGHGMINRENRGVVVDPACSRTCSQGFYLVSRELFLNAANTVQ